MEGLLMDHNSLSKRPMNLAMFLYAVEHTSRVARWAGKGGRRPAPASSTH